MDCGDQLVFAQREYSSEGTVGGGESRYQRVIASSDSGQIGNSVNSFLSIDMVGGVLADMIGGVVAGTRGGGLQLAQFLIGRDKKGLELGPGLVGLIPSLPKLAIVIE